LFSHGGIWLGVGSILFRKFDDIFWRELGNPESPYSSPKGTLGKCLASFTGARKGISFIERWMRVRLEVWEDECTNCVGLHEDPLLKARGLIIM